MLTLTKDEMEKRIISSLEKSTSLHPQSVMIITIAVYPKTPFPSGRESIILYNMAVFDLLCELEERGIVKNVNHASWSDKDYLMRTSKWILIKNLDEQQ